MSKKICCTIFCLLLFVLLNGCGGEKYETYNAVLAGKTFQRDEGQTITFYEDGLATYDYRNGVSENHHYCYKVTVVKETETAIELSLETILTDSEVFHNEDYIDNGPEPATYFFADDTLEYYFTYTCLYDPNDATFFSNTYSAFNTVCAQSGCRMYIAPAGHTKYCTEHTAACDYCGNFVDPGVLFCPGCPYCHSCGVKISSPNVFYCGTCSQGKVSYTPTGGKCYWCNGTGKVKYYYGGSDIEAYFSGHDPYWYGQCGSCGGTGKN